MKNFLTVLTLILAPLISQASDCGTMGHAAEAVVAKFNIDSSDAWVEALYGADESMAGGTIVYRKIVVRVKSAHNASYRDMVTTYTILHSYDGPYNGDYCSLSGVEFKSDVCKNRPDLRICSTPTTP